MGKTKDIVHLLKAEIGGDVNYNSVQKYIAECGWLIVLYGDDKHKHADDTLLKIGKTSYAYSVESFTYEDGSRKIIFINVKHKANTLFLLLHECGHIKAGHTKQDGIYGRSDKAAERQANRIARGVLRNNKLIAYTHKQPIKTAVIGGICCTIIFSAAYIGGTTIYNNLLSQTNAETTQQVEPTPETVPEQSPEPPLDQEQTQGSGQDGSSRQAVPKSNGSGGESSGTTQAPKQTQRPQQPAATPYQPPATQAPVTTPQPTRMPEQPSTQTVIPRGQTVWMTSDGDKYRTLRDCQSLKNKTNVTAYDISEVFQKYGKCQHCINRGG